MLYDNYKHSASAGNLWLECPSAFLWKYGFRNWGRDKPRMNMGKAAEQAVWAVMKEGQPKEHVAAIAVSIFDAMQEGEVADEREHVGKIAAGFIAALEPLGPVLGGRMKKAVHLSGLAKMISYEPDLLFESCGVDLKATLAMPSEPRSSHIRQVGLYACFEHMPFKLCYATAKKHALFDLTKEQLDAGGAELLTCFRQIERWHNRFNDPREAGLYMPLNTDSFYFDEEDVPVARTLWSSFEEQTLCQEQP